MSAPLQHFPIDPVEQALPGYERLEDQVSYVPWHTGSKAVVELGALRATRSLPTALHPRPVEPISAHLHSPFQAVRLGTCHEGCSSRTGCAEPATNCTWIQRKSLGSGSYFSGPRALGRIHLQFL